MVRAPFMTGGQRSNLPAEERRFTRDNMFNPSDLDDLVVQALADLTSSDLPKGSFAPEKKKVREVPSTGFAHTILALRAVH
jgi:hypothetical protein